MGCASCSAGSVAGKRNSAALQKMAWHMDSSCLSRTSLPCALCWWAQQGLMSEQDNEAPNGVIMVYLQHFCIKFD